MTTISGRPLLILQHHAWEGPGLIARAAHDVPRTTRIVLDDADPILPAARDLAGLVVMGGAMAADDDVRYPGLPAERRLIAEAVAADVPVLGICLGMQLLAHSLGSAVHRGHGTELGFAPVDVVAPDPLLAPLGPRPSVLHWHSDAVDLPADATLLASSGTTPVQAFRAGSALGLQFHLEIDEPMLTEWLAVPAMVADLRSHGVTDLAGQGAATLPGLVPAATVALTHFAEAVRARG